MINWILLALVFLVANLPWFSDKLFYVINLKSKHDGNVNKRLWWCFLELAVLYLLVGLVVRYAEYATHGQIAPQAWEFYSTTICLFLVFAFPGFVYKVMWKR